MSAAAPEARELVAARSRALTQQDHERLEGLCHPQLRYTHSTGFTDTYDTYLERCRSGYYAYRAIDCTVQAACHVGDTLLVEEQMLAQVEIDGSPRDVDTRALSVWVREDANWRLVGYHAAPR